MITLHKHIWVIIFWTLLALPLSAQTETGKNDIWGKIVLDSTWQKVIYLSEISSFEDMYTISPDLIIDKSDIDVNGAFTFSTIAFPLESRLYRLHIPKKGSPSSSLIIGGPNENHFFIVASKGDKLKIFGTSKETPFNNVVISGSPSSTWMQKIDVIASYIDSIGANISKENREFMSIGITEKLRVIADTLSYQLPASYALYRTDFKEHHKKHPEYYQKFFDKHKSENSIYVSSLKQKLPTNPDQKTTIYIVGAFCSFLLGFLAHFIWVQRKTKSHQRLKLLSVQERKVFEMIKTGASNKEISEAYNIGVSTVKSHVNKIYSKLNIKSRKEAMDYRQQNSSTQ